MTTLERTYNIPLRKEFMKAPKYKRTNKAVIAVREFLARHMKSDTIIIGSYLNSKLWERGIRRPPHHVKVTAVKDGEGVVTAELVGAPQPKPREEKAGKEGKAAKAGKEEKAAKAAMKEQVSKDAEELKEALSGEVKKIQDEIKKAEGELKKDAPAEQLESGEAAGKPAKAVANKVKKAAGNPVDKAAEAD